MSGRPENPRRGRVPAMRHQINERIRAREVRVIAADGTQVGVVPTRDALVMAQEQGLDLVLIAPGAEPPVCRIVEYSKFKYQLEQKERHNRSHQVETKEMKFRVRIGQGDLETKCRKIREILDHGDRVKIVVQLRGREVTHPELGRETMERILGATEQSGTPAGPVHNDGRNISAVLNPKKK